MKKKSLGILVALLLIAGAGVYTYARYTSSFVGTGTAEVAKWSVNLKQGGSAVAENFELTITPNENEFVAEGKMAPGRTATAKLVLDLTGTEVAVDYEIDLSSVPNLPEGMEIASVKATVDGEQAQELNQTNGVYSGYVALANVSKTITFDITLNWENLEANNTANTNTGKAAADISIPVTVTAKQHIG